MKKLFYLLTLLSLLFIGCKSDDTIEQFLINNGISSEIKPSTKVFVQGTLVVQTNTINRTRRMFGYGDNWPKSMVSEGWEAAKFSVRIDGSIPGYVNQDKSLYWGGTEGPNLGKVDITYPFNTYDDRGLDYYKIDTKTGENVGLFRYVLDPTGVEVEKVLIEKPDVWEILEYWKGKDNTKEKDKLISILENKDNLKVIWYVAKEVGGQYLWHVNGIITDKTISDVFEEIKDEIEDDGLTYDPIDPTKVEDNVEVDIHLQEHKDWNEIKTSIHIRTDAKDVEVNLPISYDNIVEQDDFAIRVFDYYFSNYELKNIITHNENGITIKIENIDVELINSLKTKFGDGITVEVHSYCTKLEGVWEELKNSTVKTTNECNVKYKITTAFNPNEEVWGF